MDILPRLLPLSFPKPSESLQNNRSLVISPGGDDHQNEGWVMKILMMAAHGGYGSESVPLGGGAAVFERLCHHWQGQDLELVSCGAGPLEPEHGKYHQLATPQVVPSKLGALAYAKFCQSFEAESTDLALRLRPDLVLSHDISEGPNIAQLRKRGIEVATISHVDVVDIFNRLYLGSYLDPASLTNLFRRTSSLPWPALLKLVFEKQQQVMTRGVVNIVPSSGAAQLLRRCYPSAKCPIETIGWGAPNAKYTSQALDREAQRIRSQHSIPKSDRILLTLSRLSPEKAQDRLLRAVAYAEGLGQFPPDVTIVVAGAPAFMKGTAHQRKLQNLALKLKSRVVFCGHVGGLEKAAWYRTAHLFVVNSLHESYGLTTLEAMQQACPVVAMRSFGTQATVSAQCGRLVSPGPALEQRLWGEISLLLHTSGQERYRRLSLGAERYASEQTFAKTSQRILHLLRDLTRNRST